MIPHHARAYHEAAHVLVGRRFGWTVEAVDIEADGDSGGRVEFAPPPSLADLEQDRKIALQRQRLVESMIVFLAGPAAQRIVAPRSRVPACARRDHEAVDRWAHLLSASPRSERALLRYVEQEANALVRGAWSSIAAVADALVQRGILSGDEVDAIIEPIKAAQAMQVDAYIGTYGLPNAEQVEQHQAEQRAKARKVERRHIAEPGLRSILHRIGTGNQAPITADDLDAMVRGHAASHGLDADAAVRKLWGCYSRQQDALQWRAVETSMSTMTGWRH